MAYNSGSGSLFVPKMCKKTMPVLDDQSWELSSGSENASAGLNHERWMRWTHTWHSGPGEEATWQGPGGKGGAYVAAPAVWRPRLAGRS